MKKRDGLRVLVAATDVYSATGGGETFFKGLFRHNGGCSYTYFESEYAAPALDLPANVEAVKLERRYRSGSSESDFQALSRVVPHLDFSGEGDRIADVIDMAASVRGREFDIIEIPDYLVHGWLLPPLLKHFGVKWQKSVLSMHGVISDALRDNWAGDAVGDLSILEETEALLYRACDIRYGIGRSYTEAWSQTEGLAAALLDPKHILDVAGLSRLRDEAPEEINDARPADLAFVGRQDKWKGPDLFLELCSLVPKKLYSYIHFYGPATEVYGYHSTTELARLGEYRGIRYQSNRKVPRPLLLSSFTNQRIVTVLPSRRDTFNLTAVESILCGCPTAISTRCGAAEYLDAALPGVPYLKFDLQDLHGAANDIGDLLKDYDARRTALRKALQKATFSDYGRTISEIYEAEPTADSKAVDLAARAGLALVQILSPKEDAQLDRTREELTRHFQHVVSETGYRMGGEPFDTALSMSARLARIGRRLGLTSSNPSVETVAARKLAESEQVLAELQPHSGAADRVKTYSLMADLEGLRGNAAIKAAYLARCMRLTGHAEPADVDELCQLLESVGLPEEAKVARMTFLQQHEELYTYLKSRRVDNSMTPQPGIVERKDYRTNPAPRVSVIVSVYNGASKMARFTRMLEGQTEFARANMEVIFVDSNSVDDTNKVLNALLSKKGNSRKLSALYVRSSERETIQKAWNRGIAEARGEIVTFLGNDEAMRPDTLDQFLEAFDKDPSLDWIQGNAIVTEVDPDGAYVKDIFPHRRVFDSQNVHYLECCYIGFAGAAYRRELHTRFGLYDPAFRSAGDNEFKNRILHQINVQTIDETLGLFLNYPETRTTESPIAELEDIRAWYAFRTPAGIRLAFEGQSDARCVAQFYQSLNYSRSYSREASTDLEYAMTMAAYIQRYRPRVYGQIANLVPAAQMVLDGYKIVDQVDTAWVNPSSSNLEDDLNHVKQALVLVARGSQLLQSRGHNIPFWYRNDNRSQQHYFPWPSFQRQFSAPEPLTWAEVAGAQDLAEIVSGSRPEFGFADFTRAWKTNDVHQLMRLYGEPRLDVFMPTFVHPDLRDLVREVAEHVPRHGGHRMSMVVSGPAPSDLINVLASNIYLTGTVETERPLLAAARFVALPGFTLESGRRYLQHLFDAAWQGRPVVMGHGVVQAIGAILPGFDTSGFEIAQEAEGFGRRLYALHADPTRRERALVANEAFISALQAAGMAPMATRPPASTEFWNGDVRGFNHLVHMCFEGAQDCRGSLVDMERYRGDAAYGSMADGVIDGLMASQNSPMLGTQQDLFTSLAAFTPAPTITVGYARLHLAGNQLLLPAAKALLGAIDHHRGRNRSETALGAWRSGRAAKAVGPAPQVRAVIVMAPPSFWSSTTGAALKPALERIAKTLGGSLLLIGADGGQFGLPSLQELESPEVEGRFKTADVVALLGEDITDGQGEVGGVERGEAVAMWAQALASDAAVLGTDSALWFAQGLSTSVMTSTSAKVLERLEVVMADKKTLSDAHREKDRLLSWLGVTGKL